MREKNTEGVQCYDATIYERYIRQKHNEAFLGEEFST